MATAALVRLGRPIVSLRQLLRMRPLLEPERAFLAAEFGESLDLTRLRVTGGGHPFGRFAWQPGAGWMQFADRAFDQNDPGHPLRTQFWPVLAHEALHVWQRVHRHHRFGVSVDGLLLGVVRGRAAYRYDASSSDPEDVLRTFQRGNIEQQGQIFEDYVRSNVHVKQARDARFEHVARYVRERRLPDRA